MCGLIGFIGNKNSNNFPDVGKEFILDQYDLQRSRGTQGYGLIRADKNMIKIRRAEHETKALIDVTQAIEKILFFHHRTPTSTPNKQDQTHPMFISNGELEHDWLIQHNGSIHNCDELKKYHMNELGYVYRTNMHTQHSRYGIHKIEKFNDSESFAIELVRYLEGRATEINIKGSVAFLAIKLDKKTGLAKELYWGKNDSISPLVYEETPAGIVIASELPNGKEVLKHTAESLKTVHVYNNEKNLLEKTKTLGLIFKEPTTKTIDTPSHYPTMGFGAQNAKKEETEIKTKNIKETAYKERAETNTLQIDEKLPKETPEGYTDREWAITKMVKRNNKTFQEIIQRFFDDTTYQEIQETEERKLEMLDELEVVIDDLIGRGEDIKAHFDKIENKEAEEDAIKEIERDLKEEAEEINEEYLADPNMGMPDSELANMGIPSPLDGPFTTHEETQPWLPKKRKTTGIERHAQKRHHRQGKPIDHV